MKFTRSAYLSYLRCPRKMYFQQHGQPRESSSDPATRMFIEQGRRVSELARGAFAGGTLVTHWGADSEDLALERTAALVADPQVPAIYDGAFAHEGLFVRADILRRREDGTWHLALVKSSASLKENHLHELALVKHVLEACGLRVGAVTVLHLNRSYLYRGGDYDPAGIFTRREVDTALPPCEERLRDALPLIRELLAAPDPPEVTPGSFCQRPGRCDYYDCCQAAPAGLEWIGCLPEAAPELLERLAGLGVTDIRDIPADFPLNPRQERARQSCLSGASVLAPSLAGELEALRYPLLFVDFEAASPALPRFAGMHPFDPLSFQWSLHCQDAPGAEPRHHEFLYCGPEDPRERFIRALLEAVDGSEGSLVVYNKDFESDRLKEMAAAYPELAGRIGRLRDRLWDLCAVIMNNVYHPQMRGSFSIKSVLPALVPDMSYAGLPVANGVTAGAVCQRLMDVPPDDPERLNLESQLRDYCRLDTLAMLYLVEYLRRQVTERPGQDG